jgi:hypothetical protein
MRTWIRVGLSEFMRLDKKLADDATLTRIQSAFWAGRMGASSDLQRYDNQGLLDLTFDVRLPVRPRQGPVVPLFWSES